MQIVMAFALVGCLSASVAQASVKDSDAMRVELTEAEKEKISNDLIHYGTSPQAARQLIERFEAGYAWDSFTPGKEPVSTSQRHLANTVETVEAYADGSLVVSTVPDFEALATQPQTRGITGCQYSKSGSTQYWKNCDGTVNLITISMGFKFNYQNVNHRNPKITKYWAYHHHIIGGALSNFRFDRISQSQVRLSADFDLAFQGFPAGWTAWMQVNVTGDNAWTSNN